MKYLRLFENFFADIESAVSNAGQPVLARKPQDSVQSEKPTLAKPEKPKKKKKLDQVETTEDEPNSYGEWLKTQVKEVVEFDDTDKLFSMPSDKRTEDYITGRFG